MIRILATVLAVLFTATALLLAVHADWGVLVEARASDKTKPSWALVPAFTLFAVVAWGFAWSSGRDD